jgi:hypothetical protein
MPLRAACLALTGAAVLAMLIPARGDVLAAEANGGAPGEWLSRYVGARSAAMGGAFVATADDALGVVWNPAGLSFLDQNEAHFETARLFEDTSLNTLSFAVPASRLPSFGATLITLGTGSIERTNELNEVLGDFQESELAFLLTASKSLTPRLALGTTLKLVNQSIEEFAATGVGADVGVVFDATPSLRLGVSMLNLGGPGLTLRATDESFPTDVRAGAAYRTLGGRGLLALELQRHGDFGTSFHVGSEVWVHSHLALRLGYNDTHVGGGLGLALGHGMAIDYGLTDHELGLSNRIGLTYHFGGFRAQSTANPPVFSPLGQASVTRIELEARTKSETSEWSLEIRDRSEQLVRRFGGRGQPPSHVMWDGKDEAGMPLSDGAYVYQFSIRDSDGRALLGDRQTIVITTDGPQGAVPAVVD